VCEHSAIVTVVLRSIINMQYSHVQPVIDWYGPLHMRIPVARHDMHLVKKSMAPIKVSLILICLPTLLSFIIDEWLVLWCLASVEVAAAYWAVGGSYDCWYSILDHHRSTVLTRGYRIGIIQMIIPILCTVLAILPGR
jgi:hypothetical protein